MIDNEIYATVIGRFHLNENKREGDGRSGKNVGWHKIGAVARFCREIIGGLGPGNLGAISNAAATCNHHLQDIIRLFLLHYHRD